MTEQLLDLLDGLNSKQEKLDLIVDMLGAEVNYGLLEDEKSMILLMITESLGGNKGNYEYMTSFYLEPFHEYLEGAMNREEFIEQIKVVIDKNLTR